MLHNHEVILFPSEHTGGIHRDNLMKLLWGFNDEVRSLCFMQCPTLSKHWVRAGHHPHCHHHQLTETLI